MLYYTIGRSYLPGKIAQIYCSSKDTLKNLAEKENSFLLLILCEGTLSLQLNGKRIHAAAPAFLCFNEKENPTLIRKYAAKILTIYFHPQFLNTNMTFDNIRSDGYISKAIDYDMFLMRPFLNGRHVYPMTESYLSTCTEAFYHMEKILRCQPDSYWSCRSRCYFMEIILLIERMNSILDNQGALILDEEDGRIISSDVVRSALLFIDSHYMDKIRLEDIVAAADSNHTTLTQLFRMETNMTPMEYLWDFRIKMAKKALAFTEVPIKEVAFLSGFSTIAHFSRTFKEITGLTPAKFRKKTVQDRKAAFQ